MRQRHFLFIRQRERGARWQRHQRGKLRAGQFQILTAQGQQIDGIEQGTLVGEHLCFGQQALLLDLTGANQCLIDPFQQGIHPANHALGTECAPIAVTHILQDVLHHFTAALLGHQHLIRLLFCAVIGNAEIEQVP